MEDLFAKYATPDKKKVSTTSSSIQLTPKEKLDLSVRLNADSKYITACRDLEQMTSGLSSKATDVCGSFKLNGSTTIENGAKTLLAKFTKIVPSKNVSNLLPLTAEEEEIQNTHEPSPVRAEISAPKISKFSLLDELAFNSLSRNATSNTALPKTNCHNGDNNMKKGDIDASNDRLLSIPSQSKSKIDQSSSGKITDVKTSKLNLKSVKPLASAVRTAITTDSDDDFELNEWSGKTSASSQSKSSKISFTSPSVVSKSPRRPSKFKLKSSIAATETSSKTSKFVLKKKQSAGANDSICTTNADNGNQPHLSKSPSTPSEPIVSIKTDFKDKNTVEFEPKTATKPSPVRFEDEPFNDLDDDADYFDQITNNTCTLPSGEPHEVKAPIERENQIPNRRTSLGNVFNGLDIFISQLNESSTRKISVCVILKLSFIHISHYTSFQTDKVELRKNGEHYKSSYHQVLEKFFDIFDKMPVELLKNTFGDDCATFMEMKKLKSKLKAKMRQTEKALERIECRENEMLEIEEENRLPYNEELNNYTSTPHVAVSSSYPSSYETRGNHTSTSQNFMDQFQYDDEGLHYGATVIFMNKYRFFHRRKAVGSFRHRFSQYQYSLY